MAALILSPETPILASLLTRCVCSFFECEISRNSFHFFLHLLCENISFLCVQKFCRCCPSRTLLASQLGLNHSFTRLLRALVEYLRSTSLVYVHVRVFGSCQDQLPLPVLGCVCGFGQDNSNNVKTCTNSLS